MSDSFRTDSIVLPQSLTRDNSTPTAVIYPYQPGLWPGLRYGWAIAEPRCSEESIAKIGKTHHNNAVTFTKR